MSLPEILAPDGTPPFITDGHEFTDSSPFSSVSRGTGHSRLRRICTSVPRVINVSWILSSTQMAAVDGWFERTLLVGQRRFTARFFYRDVAPVFWDASWVAPYDAEPIAGTIPTAWRVTGSLHLLGEASTSPPTFSGLAVEVTAPLVVTGSIQGDTAFAVEVHVALLPDTPLAVEIRVPLLVEVPSFLLTEDGFAIELETLSGLLLEYS